MHGKYKVTTKAVALTAEERKPKEDQANQMLAEVLRRNQGA